MNEKREWATLVVEKWQGGRAIVVNSSERGLFERGDWYFNHKLYEFGRGDRLNVVVRLSPKGRRMVQKITVKER
jgi:hypothetical protein